MDRLRPYAQLLRLPNVFTALADIALAALAAQAVVDEPLRADLLTFLLLCLASACLYCGGMVWNDYFDVEQDKRERPFRPIPSGRVSGPAVLRLGTGLLVGGWVAAALAGFHAEGSDPVPAAVGVLLVAASVLYARWRTRT